MLCSLNGEDLFQKLPGCFPGCLRPESPQPGSPTTGDSLSGLTRLGLGLHPRRTQDTARARGKVRRGRPSPTGAHGPARSPPPAPARSPHSQAQRPAWERASSALQSRSRAAAATRAVGAARGERREPRRRLHFARFGLWAVSAQDRGPSLAPLVLQVSARRPAEGVAPPARGDKRPAPGRSACKCCDRIQLGAEPDCLLPAGPGSQK